MKLAPLLALTAMLATTLLAALPAAAQQRRPVNVFSERLKRLPLDQQRSVLRRAVLDSGLSCRRIGSVGFQGPYKNLEMWRANCGGSDDYGVFIGLDQSVQVRTCADVARFHLPACRPIAPPPPLRRRP